MTQPHANKITQWIPIKLDEIAADGLQNGIYKPATDYGEGTPIIRINDFDNSGNFPGTELQRLALTKDEIKRFEVQENDILINRVNSLSHIGKSIIVKGVTEPTVYESNMMRLRLDGDRLLPDFLACLLQTSRVRNYFRAVAKKAVAQASINQEDIKALEFLLPPLPEQRKIAAILSTWDEAIDLTAQLIAAKQRRKQALMQRLLTGKVRFPGFISSSKYQPSNFGFIPEDWKIVKLGAVMNPVSRTVPVDPQKEYKLLGVRWYGEGAHIHNTIIGSDIQMPTLNHIWEDDILYNKMWTTKGAFAIAKQVHHGAYSTNEYPQFRAIDGKLDPRYFEYVFRLSRFQHDATALCRGTTGRARLNPKDFLQLEIPLPSFEEQRRIADLLYGCSEELDLLHQKLAALRRQKQGLMQQLLTGKVRVNGR